MFEKPSSGVMKLLLDAGIFFHAEIAVPVTQSMTISWGRQNITLPIAGAVRKPLDADSSRQAEIDALFTVGRLIREGMVEAFRYHEVMVEICRGKNASWINALKKCKILDCEPALHRSKFRGTADFRESARKGGKKDCEDGKELSGQTQLALFCWLKDLKPQEVEMLIRHAADIRLTPFEVESLQHLKWFQTMCERSGSAENFVDVFHLWTAARNGMGLLTLDKKIKRLVERVGAEKSRPVLNLPEVFFPTDLLRVMGDIAPDPVPFQAGVFYQPDLQGYVP